MCLRSTDSGFESRLEYHGPVAQSEERFPVTEEVAGSNPVRIAIKLRLTPEDSVYCVRSRPPLGQPLPR